MLQPIELPNALSINAWTGTTVPSGALLKSSLRWMLTRRSGGSTPAEKKLLPTLADERDWQHENIGWGLVLPENEQLTEAERATAVDAPEPIRRLVDARPSSAVLRYRGDNQDGYLRRYYPDRKLKDFSLVDSPPGVKPDCLPRYLLLFGGPDVIPWSFQYAANLTHYVGRLALGGAALERYVGALIDDWKDMPCDPRAPVVWSVSFGQPDITWLMDAAISRKLFAAYENDQDGDLSRRQSLFDANATVGKLTETLATTSSALVVTTSHGMTGPLEDFDLLRSQLGLLVDVKRQLLDPTVLLAAWKPNGAIWYAHACCSAGSDAPSCYAGLLDPASDVARVLTGTATASGRRVAPFPEALLGAEHPLRAFIGHVEPTFDYTLRDPTTSQPLTSSLRTALYEKLYLGDMRSPVGWALASVFADAGRMLGLWARALSAVNGNEPNARQWAFYRQLTALDRQHTVILGDPTVALPAITTTPI